MIQSLISLTLSNALGALALAMATVVVTRFVRTPALAHALWILVLVKLVSPAAIELPVRLPGDRPLLALRAPEETAAKIIARHSSRLGETRPPGWAGLSETGGSESRRESDTLSSAEIANDRGGDSLFDVENSQSVVSQPEELPRARHDDSETAEPNGVVFYRQVQRAARQIVRRSARTVFCLPRGAGNGTRRTEKKIKSTTVTPLTA